MRYKKTHQYIRNNMVSQQITKFIQYNIVVVCINGMKENQI